MIHLTLSTFRMMDGIAHNINTTTNMFCVKHYQEDIDEDGSLAQNVTVNKVFPKGI